MSGRFFVEVNLSDLPDSYDMNAFLGGVMLHVSTQLYVNKTIGFLTDYDGNRVGMWAIDPHGLMEE